MSDPHLEPPKTPAVTGDAEETTPNEIMLRVMVGLALWGLILGIGAMLFGVGDSGGIELGFRPLRGLVVWGCVGAFLGFWGLLLRGRSGNGER